MSNYGQVRGIRSRAELIALLSRPGEWEGYQDAVADRPLEHDGQPGDWQDRYESARLTVALMRLYGLPLPGWSKGRPPPPKLVDAVFVIWRRQGWIDPHPRTKAA